MLLLKLLHPPHSNRGGVLVNLIPAPFRKRENEGAKERASYSFDNVDDHPYPLPKFATPIFLRERNDLRKKLLLYTIVWSALVQIVGILYVNLFEAEQCQSPLNCIEERHGTERRFQYPGGGFGAACGKFFSFPFSEQYS